MSHGHNQLLDQVGLGLKGTSVADLMATVTRLGTHKPTRRYIARGRANMSWSLEPSLVRTLRAAGAPHDEAAAKTAEKKLVTEARDWPAPEFAGLHSDQQLPSFLQHHGVPTGLKAAAVGGSFEYCQRGSCPGTIWVIRPSRMKQKGGTLIVGTKDWVQTAPHEEEPFAAFIATTPALANQDTFVIGKCALPKTYSARLDGNVGGVLAECAKRAAAAQVVALRGREAAFASAGQTYIVLDEEELDGDTW